MITLTIIELSLYVGIYFIFNFIYSKWKLFWHGTKDETIPITVATKSYNYLNDLKNVTFKEYKDMGHCMSEEEINDVKMVFAKWVCHN